jgi:putative endonuclease
MAVAGRRSAGRAEEHSVRANATGRWGEHLAVTALQARGYRILATNWHARGEIRGEIDIVAEQGGELVFVEVKTRRTSGWGAPAEAVTPAKARRLLALAQAFLMADAASVEGARPDERPWRIDIVAIELSRNAPPQLEVIPNAVSAESVRAAWL